MNLRILLLAVASWLTPSFAFAQATSGVDGGPVAPVRCERVEFEVLPFTHAEDFTTSIASIGAVQVAGKAHNSSTPGFGLGLVRAVRDVQLSHRTDDAGCRVFRARLGYIDNVLFVARELRRNTCAFNHVLEHETYHLDIYRTFLATTLPTRLEELKPGLESAVAGLDDIKAASELERRLHLVLREVKPLHDAHDSDEEYDRNAGVCGGVIRRITKGL